MSKRPAWCGPHWMPERLRALASTRFNASCRLHDLHYQQQQIPRREADRRFLRNMLSRSIGGRDRARAWAYYAAVRVAGWVSWKR